MLWSEALGGLGAIIVRVCIIISSLGGIDITLPNSDIFYVDAPCTFEADDFCEVQGYELNGGTMVHTIRFDPYNKGYKGYISQWIDVIFNNPIIELVVLLFISGTAIAFYKRIIRT